MDIFSAKDIVKKYDKHTALDGVLTLKKIVFLVYLVLMVLERHP
jgi:hypothetical protein